MYEWNFWHSFPWLRPILSSYFIQYFCVALNQYPKFHFHWLRQSISIAFVVWHQFSSKIFLTSSHFFEFYIFDSLHTLALVCILQFKLSIILVYLISQPCLQWNLCCCFLYISTFNKMASTGSNSGSWA